MCANHDTGFTAAIRDARPSRGDHHLFAHRPRSPTMLHYAVVFLVIALIAALFGFGGIAAGAVGIAKILFLIFAVLAVVTFLFGLTRKS
jgi:uncharacterized membrane protein YtjA (UPF0391 family)